MEENLNTTQDTSVSVSASSTLYASFWARLAALLIDVFLVGLVASFFGGIFEMVERSLGLVVDSGVSALLSLAYYVFMTSKYGATLGKMALKIRVQNEETGANLTIMDAILREVVGKIVSGIVLGLGYLWMLWDPKKQTWHDKIGRSVVVKAD